MNIALGPVQPLPSWQRRAQRLPANSQLAVSSQRKSRRVESTSTFRERLSKIRVRGVKAGNSLTSSLKMRMRGQTRQNHQKRGTPFSSLTRCDPSYALELVRSLKGMSVDDFLGASFMEEDEDVSLTPVSQLTPGLIHV